MALTWAKCLGWATTALCLALTSAAAAPAGASTLNLKPGCCRNAPPWREFSAFTARGDDGGFGDVAAISRNDAWAVGDTFTGTLTTGGIAVHWNGKVWRRVPMPLKQFIPVSVSGRPGSSAWIFGYQYEAGVDAEDFPAYGLERVGAGWQVHRLPSTRAEWDVFGDLQSAVIDNSDVWVTGNGSSLNAATANIAWNWTGASWVRHPLHAEGVLSISASSGSNVWVAGDGRKGRTFALRWNGSGWLRMRIPNLTNGSVVADSAHNVWLAGSVLRNTVEVGAVTRWNGKHWSARSVIPSVLVPSSPTSTDLHGGLWFGRYAHETGGTWYFPTALPEGRHCQVGLGVGAVAAIPGTSAAWFAGTCGQTSPDRFTAIIALDGHL
jgi:hypothetical protein